MNSIEEGLFGARQADLEANTPGRIGLNAALDEQDRVARAESDAEADKKWRDAPPQENFNHREAHRQGVNLTEGNRPNQFVTPGAVNVAGHDLATGTKVKSVVSRAYEGAAYYGASQLQRSWSVAGKDKSARTMLSAEKPPQDVMGFTAVAASMQGSGSKFEDFAQAFSAWPDDQLAAAWNAGTDVLRQLEITKKEGWGPTVGLYMPSPLHLDFDVRMADKDFQQVGRRLYQHFHGSKFPDTDIEAARWLADHMRNLDFSTPMMAAIMLKGKSASPEVHKDYIRAIEAWSLTNMEWRLMPQLGNFGRILIDPFNLAGASIGKLTLVTAGRAAALDFFKRMAVGAAGGAASGVIQATVSESAQGRIATGEKQVAGAVVPAAMAAPLAGVIPEALALAGKGIKRGAQAFRRKDLPPLRSNNVMPTGEALEGEYIPAGGGVYGEITLPNRPGDQPVRTTPEPALLEAPRIEEPVTPATPGFAEQVNFEQQPYEQGPAIREGGGPPYPGTTIRGTYWPAVREIERTQREHGISWDDALDMLRQEHAADMHPSERVENAWTNFTQAFGRGTADEARALDSIEQDIDAGQLTPESREMLERTPEGREIIALMDDDPTLADDRALVQIGEIQARLGLSEDQVVEAEWNAGIREPMETQQHLQVLQRTEEIMDQRGYDAERAYSVAAAELVEQQVGRVTADEADQMLGGPGITTSVSGSQAGRLAGDLAGAEAIAALPPVVAPPPLPHDPNSRVFVDPSTGYYSPIQKIVAEHSMPAQLGKDWLGSVVKTKRGQRTGEADVRLDEVAATGLEEWLTQPANYGRKIPREEVLDFLDKNLVKIQRYPLIPQVRNTVPLSVHLSKTNPQYELLELQFEDVEGQIWILRQQFDEASKKALDALQDYVQGSARFTIETPEAIAKHTQELENEVAALTQHPAHQKIDDLTARSQALQAHMEKIAGEERKAMLATGNVPPGIHGLEHLVDGQRGGPASWHINSLISNLLAYMESAQTHQYQLSRARNDRTRSIYQEKLADDEQQLKVTWAEMETAAANAGAVIRPEDLDRVLPHFKYQYHDLRYSALLGKDEPGAKIRNGVDPLGHQVNVYIHPEGLQRPGTEIHPGGTATGILGWAYSSERNLVNGETIRFIDEGQSDHVKARHKADQAFQEVKKLMAAGDPSGRLGGSAEARAEIAAAETYDDWVWNKYRNGKILGAKSASAAVRMEKRLPEKWADVTPEQKVVMRRDPIFADYSFTDSGLGLGNFQAIPFQIFAPTAQFNIFKSEMFNAAREGKQWFGWTTTEVAQGRYPAESAQFVENPEFNVGGRNGDRVVMTSHDEHGRRRGVHELTFEHAREVADRMGDQGSELHKFIDSAESAWRTQNEIHATVPPGSIYMHTEKPVMWDAGSYHDYNGKVLKEMNKYLRRFGKDVKVELVEMPTAPGSPTVVKVWGVRLAGAGGIGAALLASGVAIGAPREKK